MSVDASSEARIPAGLPIDGNADQLEDWLVRILKLLPLTVRLSEFRQRFEAEFGSTIADTETALETARIFAEGIEETFGMTITCIDDSANDNNLLGQNEPA